MSDLPEKGRRKGRGRPDRDTVPNEELGWLADLRQAREAGGDLGPGPGAGDEPGTAPTNLFSALDSGDEPLRDEPFRGASLDDRGASLDEQSHGEPRLGDVPPPREGRRGFRWSGLRRPDPAPSADQPPRQPGPVQPHADDRRRDEPYPEPSRAAGSPWTAEPPPPRLPDAPPISDQPRRGLGSRFASLRGRGADPPRPVIPAPATSPLSPEVLAPGRTPPPPQRPVPDLGRPHRDPDVPGRHEPQIASGRTSPSDRGAGPGGGGLSSGGLSSAGSSGAGPGGVGPGGGGPGGVGPGGPVEPGRPEPGRSGAPSRPVPAPGWHDLTTGEKPPLVPRDEPPAPGRRPPGRPAGPPVRSAGLPAGAPSEARPRPPSRFPGAPGGAPDPRGPRPAQGAAPLPPGPPLRSPSVPGPPRTPSVPGPPPRDAGLGPRDAGAGPREAGSGPRDAGAGPRQAGSGPRDAGFGPPDAAGRRSVGVAGPPPRRGTGEQPPVGSGPRHATGEQAPVQPRHATGEQPAVPPRHATGEQPVVDPPGRRTAELRRQAGRVPVVALALAAFVLLAALPAAFLIRDISGDPVFAALDELKLPSWATQAHQDASTGNRWCLHDCRLRERTWRSAKPAQATDPVYRQALTAAGWRLRPSPGCPKQPTGAATCWQRDAYVLDVWIRDAPCDLSNIAAAQGNGSPPADPNAAIPSPGASGPPATCQGSLVTVKATDRYNPDWHD